MGNHGRTLKDCKRRQTGWGQSEAGMGMSTPVFSLSALSLRLPEPPIAIDKKKKPPKKSILPSQRIGKERDRLGDRSL